MKHYPLYPHLNLSSFRQLVDINAKEKSNHLAFQFQRREKVISITYIQFKHDVDALVSYFHLQGFHHSKIAVLSGNSYEWILTYFAAVLSNNIVVPIDKELSIVTEFEDEFHIEIPDRDIEKFTSVKDIVNYLETRV